MTNPKTICKAQHSLSAKHEAPNTLLMYPSLIQSIAASVSNHLMSEIRDKDLSVCYQVLQQVSHSHWDQTATLSSVKTQLDNST